MSSSLPSGPRAAVLQAGGDSVRGVFDDRYPMLFLPHGSADFDLAARLGRHDDAVISWADDLARFDAPVAVTAIDRKRGELNLRSRGPVERVQRRSEVRATSQIRCTVLDFDDDGVVTSPGATINLSAGGAALVVERDADVGGHADPPEVGAQVGVVLELPDRRVGAVAEVLSVRRRAARTVLRIRFSEIHPSDSTALTRHVLQAQTRRSG